MKTVTYRGPKDPRDHTTRYRVGKHLLPKRVPIEVPDDVARELAETEGHSFEVGGKTAGKKTDQADPAATKES